MICHYWYFKDIGFKYQQYVSNGCHDLDDFVILKVKSVYYRSCIVKMMQLVY